MTSFRWAIRITNARCDLRPGSGRSDGGNCRNLSLLPAGTPTGCFGSSAASHHRISSTTAIGCKAVTQQIICDGQILNGSFSQKRPFKRRRFRQFDGRLTAISGRENPGRNAALTVRKRHQYRPKLSLHNQLESFVTPILLSGRIFSQFCLEHSIQERQHKIP